MLTSTEIKLAKWLFVFHVGILYYLYYLAVESSCALVTTFFGGVVILSKHLNVFC